MEGFLTNLNARNEFFALKAFCQERGYFKPSPFAVYGEIAAVFLLFASGTALHATLPWVAVALASAGGITLVWWIHDAGHDAYFETKEATAAWIEGLGILFLGMPQMEYHFCVHRKHHAATNVVGKDKALETGPIVWSPKMSKKPLPFQELIWFFFVLPLTWPLINARCVRTLFEQKSYGRLTLLGLRWSVIPCALHFDWFFIMTPILVTGFVLGLSASLNHFHMPMDDRPLAPFPQSVFLTTQNLGHRNFLVTWLTGGLNFHIEHHLFPNMSRYNLHRVAPLVEQYSQKHGLPYNVCSGSEAIGKLAHRLQNPLAEAAR